MKSLAARLGFRRTRWRNLSAPTGHRHGPSIAGRPSMRLNRRSGRGRRRTHGCSDSGRPRVGPGPRRRFRRTWLGPPGGMGRRILRTGSDTKLPTRSNETGGPRRCEYLSAPASGAIDDVLAFAAASEPNPVPGPPTPTSFCSGRRHGKAHLATQLSHRVLFLTATDTVPRLLIVLGEVDYNHFEQKAANLFFGSSHHALNMRLADPDLQPAVRTVGEVCSGTGSCAQP